MAKSKKDRTEFVSPRQELKETKRLTAKDLLGGGILSRDVVVKQIPFILFLFVLLVFYIGNQYQGAKVMTEVVRIEERLKILRTESISITFEKMEMSKQSEVVKLLEKMNMPLKEAVLPPYKIELK
jgi:hypothetical protein